MKTSLTFRDRYRTAVAREIFVKLIGERDWESDDFRTCSPEKAAHLAVAYADTLLRELESTDYKPLNTTER